METLLHFCGNARNCLVRDLPQELTTPVVVDKLFLTSTIGTKLNFSLWLLWVWVQVDLIGRGKGQPLHLSSWRNYQWREKSSYLLYYMCTCPFLNNTFPKEPFVADASANYVCYNWLFWKANSNVSRVWIVIYWRSTWFGSTYETDVP